MARNNLALTVLSLTLGFLFIAVGLIKLTPLINEDLHKEMKVNFKRNVKVFPFYSMTKWKPKPSQYRRAVGAAELTLGLMLAFLPGKLKLIANALLVVLMGGAIYTHWALKDDLHHMTGALVFGLLLVCRLAIHMQASARDQRDERLKTD